MSFSRTLLTVVLFSFYYFLKENYRGTNQEVRFFFLFLVPYRNNDQQEPNVPESFITSAVVSIQILKYSEYFHVTEITKQVS